MLWEMYIYISTHIGAFYVYTLINQCYGKCIGAIMRLTLGGRYGYQVFSYSFDF